MLRVTTIVAMVSILLIFVSCQVSITGIRRGTVRLSIDILGIKTLEPVISMKPANYNILGYGPQGESFGIDTSEANVQVDKLLIGEWNIIVYAENETGHLIGQGSSSVIVRTGTVEPVSIFITPIDGSGSFNLGISWDPAALDIPGVEAELIDGTGDSVPLSFELTSGTASSSSQILNAGYYTLVVRLTDNGITVMGAVEVTRIVSGALTMGEYDFANVNRPGGSILVNITPLLDDPIEVTMTGEQPEILMGSSMSLSASAASETAAILYAWYLNSASIALGSELTLGADLQPGYYRVDVTAFTTDGKRAGSTSHEFAVMEG